MGVLSDYQPQRGPSATIANFAIALPLPKTTFARVFAKSQAVQTLARVLRACICV